MEKELKKYSVVIKLSAQQEDMSPAAHIDNLVYLRWAEVGRVAYFEKMEMDTSFNSKAAGPIISWQDCKYIFPMTYPDTVIVGVRTIEINDKFMKIEAAVFSEKHQRIAAISQQKVVPYSYETMGRVEMPESWRNSIKALEKDN